MTDQNQTTDPLKWLEAMAFQIGEPEFRAAADELRAAPRCLGCGCKLEADEPQPLYCVRCCIAPRRNPYRDEGSPERACDHCGKLYRGPAVYCSLACALADA